MIEFFKSAPEKRVLPAPVTEPVKKAYEMIRIDILKKEHPDLLKASEDFFANLTEHDKCAREEGERISEERGKRIDEERDVLKIRQAFAKLMQEKNKPLSEIIEFTGLSAEEINKL